MTEKVTIFDPAEHLTSEQVIADFMAGALETNDPGFIGHARVIVARAKGITQLADESGVAQFGCRAHVEDTHVGTSGS